jgi:hypothetical protein
MHNPIIKTYASVEIYRISVSLQPEAATLSREYDYEDPYNT